MSLNLGNVLPPTTSSTTFRTLLSFRMMGHSQNEIHHGRSGGSTSSFEKSADHMCSLVILKSTILSVLEEKLHSKHSRAFPLFILCRTSSSKCGNKDNSSSCNFSKLLLKWRNRLWYIHHCWECIYKLRETHLAQRPA